MRIKTELLQLRAVVTDKQGKVVEGLRVEEFELLENNRPQKIEFFSREVVGVSNKEKADSPAGAKNTDAVSPSLTPAAKPTRTIALFVDNVHLSFDSLDRTKQTLRRFVNEQMTENDLVCIVTAAGSIGIVNQFTQDRQLLLRAIEKLTLWRINDTNTLLSPFLAARIVSNNPEAIVTGMMLLDVENRGNKGTPLSILESELRSRSVMLLAEASNQRRVMLSTLKSLTERLAELPGQRLLFCFSDGFSLAGIGGGQDSDDLTPAISRAAHSGVVFYTFGAQGLTVQMLTAAQPGIVEGAKQYRLPSSPGRQGSGVAIAPMPIHSYLTARSNDQKVGLTALALDTGGKPFFETNDLNGRIAQALEENRIYYTLSYYPEDENNPKKARKLTLRVKGHPEYEVRTQRSYVPAELARAEKETAALTPRQRLARAMISPLPVNMLGISVAADYFEREGDANQVLLQTYIESDKLDYRQQEGAQAFNLEVATAIYDGTGKLISGWSDEIKGAFKAEQFESSKNAGFRQFKWLSLKPGLYQVRVGILEATTDRLGTALTWVEVPKLGQNKTLVSNLMLMYQTEEQADSTKSGSLSQFRQGIRLYRRGEELAYFLRIYPPAKKQTDGEITIQTQIVQGERIVYQSQWLPADERALAKDKISVEIGGELKLNTIKPGLYELRVLVKEGKTTQPLKRAALFGVEP
ncbi:MAG TPA: VWA domain-containing protein [Blastocatellia bacterium]|nr:VWA domain-containing protein [Blastocatellia bacterium]HMX24805.1 VWA domain-containing protein [Blastocatellia bacterium]HMZ18451.1 VWA domain-containing protein [Blastocatellia bacterium]HNG28714.1 VWA domain-containing protein [Blastocatellia bacterium]